MTNILKTPLGGIAALVGFVAVVAGIVVEVETGHDPTATIAIIGSVLGVAGLGGAGLGVVQKQTNGTNSELRAQVVDALNVVSSLASHLDPAIAQPILASTATTAVAPVVTVSATPVGVTSTPNTGGTTNTETDGTVDSAAAPGDAPAVSTPAPVEAADAASVPKVPVPETFRG